jgi:hypothetical protein
MQTTLHQDASAAECDRFVDLGADLFERADVSIRCTWPAIERAESADYVANVCVVDVAIDDVSDDVVRVTARPDFVRSDAHPSDIVRLEQRRAFVNRHALTREHAIQNRLNVRHRQLGGNLNHKGTKTQNSDSGLCVLVVQNKPQRLHVVDKTVPGRQLKI